MKNRYATHRSRLRPRWSSSAGARAGAGLAAVAALAGILSAEPVGPAADGAFLLNSGWLLRPAGRQIPLDTFPMNSVLSPDGKFLLVLHAGYAKPSIRVYETGAFREVDRLQLEDAWLGMTFAPGGRLLYVGGGATGNVHELSFSPQGKLKPKRAFSTIPRQRRRTPEDFVGDVTLSPDGRLIYAACLFRDEIAVINPQSGWVIERFRTARRPYRILFAPDGKSFFVTSWAEGSVDQHNAQDGEHLSMLRLGPQPMDMVLSDRPLQAEEGEEPPPWKARLFIALANTNRVSVAGLMEGGELQLLETIQVSLWPWQPSGMTPASLALNKSQSRLYVVCSNANAVAAVDITRKKSRVLGFLPAGWYPTGATPLVDGRLVVLNGRGGGSHPNPNGPNPTREPLRLHRGLAAPGYVARLQTGTASVIPPADEAQLFQYTKQVFRLSPYNDSQLAFVPIPEGNPVPPSPAAPPELASPIRHVLYIIKGSLTYDALLGDLGKGNGEPSLTVFGEPVTPNQHKLARQYVLFDNFYVNGDVEADGVNWSTAAIAPPFVERLWPATYAGRLDRYTYEGGELAAMPPAGYLWSNALSAGLPVRNYGLLAVNREPAPAEGEQVHRVLDPSLRKITVHSFRGFDLDYPDVRRAKAFIADLAKMEEAGEAPRLMVMRLANDHTSGTAPGKIAPKSAAADNDRALGMIVEACSKSKFWPTMAIFILEGDAQAGADHVDSHRSPAFVISPYTRRGVVDSRMYNTTSMLRTIELILGLHPLTHFDAAATPMWAAFQSEPDPAPYTAEAPRVSLTERNP